jgi:hypothetical protein
MERDKLLHNFHESCQLASIESAPFLEEHPPTALGAVHDNSPNLWHLHHQCEHRQRLEGQACTSMCKQRQLDTVHVRSERTMTLFSGLSITGLHKIADIGREIQMKPPVGAAKMLAWPK